MNFERAHVSSFHDRLRGKGWTVAVAESCTGGLLGGALTSVPGSSDLFQGGIIAYSNRVKERLLNVDEKLLEREGAVSADVAESMARGARSRLGTDVGLSVTGIAGPGGGMDSKPVGRVFFGVALPEQVLTDRRTFNGNREEIRAQSVRHVLDVALDEIG